MRLRSVAIACLLAGALPTSAFAAQVMEGTVSSVGLFNPTISLGSTQSTYSAMNGGTFEISGTGGFSNIGGTTGTLNGLLTFSNIVGTTVSQSLNNFFVFSDATGGTYNYSVTSAETRSFVNQTTSTSGTLYLLGDIVDSSRNLLTLTPASLSIQFNSTGGSAFSSALTLAVPPSGAVPEPATWAMMIGGIGVAGGAMRRRRNVRTTVTYA